MAKIAEATEEERRRYYCSGKGCKRDPISTVELDVVRRGKNTIAKRYYCAEHLSRFQNKPKLMHMVKEEGYWVSKTHAVPVDSSETNSVVLQTAVEQQLPWRKASIRKLIRLLERLENWV
jgi:hypothetical protein